MLVFDGTYCNKCRLDGKNKYAHPEYATPAARLQTFNNWPSSLPQKPHDIIKAGFFYTGEGDQVTCFNCDLSLLNWKADNVLFQNHVVIRNNCYFAKQPGQVAGQ
jgi:baculoviral IAP repeat-containing protein 7/8